MDVTRKRFLEAIAAGSALLLFHGCGGDDDDEVPLDSSCSAAIVNNHGHVLPIAQGDLDSSTPKTYDISGTAGHSHFVTLSVSRLQQLKAGTPVTVTSTETDGHTHPMTVTCIR